MITEDEAFWAGIAVAVMMLGGGFSMLFLHTFTGFGAVVLALGLMTMALTIQMRAKSIEQYEVPTPYEPRILAPTPIESPTETVAEKELPSEPAQIEAKTEHPSSIESAEPAKPVESTSTEPTQPTQPIEQPPQPQAPTEKKTEPPKSEEKPKEEPQVVAAS